MLDKKPVLIVNLLVEFAKSNELKIDSIIITPGGLYRKRFLRHRELLPWNQYYNSTLQDGVLHVYRKDVRQKYREYFTCSMDVMNAVVVPELLDFLFQRNGVIDAATRGELIRMKGGL